MAIPSPSAPVYDVIGLGFGPANIAIGGAIIDKWAASRTGDATVSPVFPTAIGLARLLTVICQCSIHQGHAPLQQVLFIEKQPEFRWHPGMLLPNSRMQIR